MAGSKSTSSNNSRKFSIHNSSKKASKVNRRSGRSGRSGNAKIFKPNNDVTIHTSSQNMNDFLRKRAEQIKQSRQPKKD